MNQRSYHAFRTRAVKLPAWQLALIGAAAAALVITLAVVATGVFLLAFPAMIVIDWFYRRRRKSMGQTSARPTVITTDYEVLPPDPANNEQR